VQGRALRAQLLLIRPGAAVKSIRTAGSGSETHFFKETGFKLPKELA
jgi:hypothetical protein